MTALRAALDAVAVDPGAWTVHPNEDGMEPFAALDPWKIPEWTSRVEATYAEVDGYHGLYVCAWPRDEKTWPSTPERADVRAMFNKPLIVGGTPAHFYVFENATEVDAILDDPEMEAAHDEVMDAKDADERAAAQRRLRDLQVRRLVRIQAIHPRAEPLDLARAKRLAVEIDALLAAMDDDDP